MCERLQEHVSGITGRVLRQELLLEEFWIPELPQSGVGILSQEFVKDKVN